MTVLNYMEMQKARVMKKFAGSIEAPEKRKESAKSVGELLGELNAMKGLNVKEREPYFDDLFYAFTR